MPVCLEHSVELDLCVGAFNGERGSWVGLFGSFGGERGSWASVFRAFSGEKGSWTGVFGAFGGEREAGLMSLMYQVQECPNIFTQLYICFLLHLRKRMLSMSVWQINNVLKNTFFLDLAMDFFTSDVALGVGDFFWN